MVHGGAGAQRGLRWKPHAAAGVLFLGTCAAGIDSEALPKSNFKSTRAATRVKFQKSNLVVGSKAMWGRVPT